MSSQGHQAAIHLQGLYKYYRYYAREIDRLKEILTGKPRYQEMQALQSLSLDVGKGEVLGIVGKNGAGKSTLLKILAGTVQASGGEMQIKGRVAALLELGGSFHPEMSGRDNIYLNASILGLKVEEIDAIYDDIVEFSGIGEFLHRPVKTYSSGMFVRLAFSIATQIDPDILIIDEALSVGDGMFARKSFDRIMDFKEQGKTILFCSHSLYQVEAISDRVLWLEKGRIKALGAPAEIATLYGESLRMESPHQESMGKHSQAVIEAETEKEKSKEVLAHITGIEVCADGVAGKVHRLMSGETDLKVNIAFDYAAELPVPSVAIIFAGGDGRAISSMGTANDGVEVLVEEIGRGRASIVFPAFPFLKGKYSLDVYLMCEKGLHVYEAVKEAAELNVEQKGLARGLVNIPHTWLQ